MVGRDMTNIFSHIQYAHRLLSVPRDKDGFVIPFLEKVRLTWGDDQIQQLT